MDPHLSEFYKYYNVSNVPKDFKNNQEVYNLFKKPKKDKATQAAKFYNFQQDDTHQADLLFLPDDKGFKYCLVIVDVATGLMDAQPLKDKTADGILKAMKDIYQRKILSLPKRLITDAGSEFQSKVSDYMKKEKVSKKTAEAGRHRQIAIVERRNQILGKVLFMKMHAKELLTGKINKEWVKGLSDIVQKINEKYGHEPLDDDALYEKFGDPWAVKQVLLPIGTRVRVQLNEPRDIIGNKLNGRFREMDTRWSMEIYKIIDYVFDPHEPVLYKINKKYKKGERVAYTRNQLQVVKETEQEPPGKILLGKNEETFIVKKILDKKKVKNKNQYLVWWKGYPKDEATWTEERLLPIEIVDEFNSK